MEALFEVIQKVRARIQKHGGALRNNEMLTRYAFVDPILRAGVRLLQPLAPEQSANLARHAQVSLDTDPYRPGSGFANPTPRVLESGPSRGQ
jgi:hypothetical protein